MMLPPSELNEQSRSNEVALQHGDATIPMRQVAAATSRAAIIIGFGRDK